MAHLLDWNFKGEVCKSMFSQDLVLFLFEFLCLLIYTTSRGQMTTVKALQPVISVGQSSSPKKSRHSPNSEAKCSNPFNSQSCSQQNHLRLFLRYKSIGSPSDCFFRNKNWVGVRRFPPKIGVILCGIGKIGGPKGWVPPCHVLT